MIKNIYADDSIPGLIGTINPPISGLPADAPSALVRILNTAMNVFLIVAALFAVLNLFLAGYAYIMAGGDSKKISEANLRITYTVVGLIIIVLAPLIAAILGIIIFGRWDAILNPDFKRVTP